MDQHETARMRDVLVLVVDYVKVRIDERPRIRMGLGVVRLKVVDTFRYARLALTPAFRQRPRYPRPLYGVGVEITMRRGERQVSHRAFRGTVVALQDKFHLLRS